MASNQSILKSTKKILGLGEESSAFDVDVMTHINAVFFTLYQLGVGPENGFAIEDDSEVWEDFTIVPVPVLNAIKTFVYLKVRLLFDPPDKPHHVTAIEQQIEELTYRLKAEREIGTWAPRSSSLSLP